MVKVLFDDGETTQGALPEGTVVIVGVGISPSTETVTIYVKYVEDDS